MPFKSKAQKRKFQMLVAEGKISPKVYAEWDKATKQNRTLPERVTVKKPKRGK